MNLLLVVFNITAVEIVSIPAYLVMGIILSKAIGFALCYAIWMKHSGVDIEVGKAYWILFLFLFSSSALATFLIYWMLYALNDTMYSGAALICTISLFISTFFALYLYARSQRYYQTIRYQEQAEQQMRAQLRHMDEIILKQNELRAMRHDMNSHLIALKSYFDKKDFEGGERYITGLNLQFLHTSLVISSGNHALDAVLNAKKTLAESKGIKFLYNLRIQEELPMDPKDLCIIFANALDNAIEACERLSDDEEKKISLVLLQDNATLFCKIANTTSLKQSESLETSKDDRINHGFGVKNIRKALEKYQAMVNFEKTNNEFIFSFSCYI